MRPVRFTIRLSVRRPRAEVWARLWSARAHTAAIPFTTARTADGRDLLARPGTRFVARTGVGPLGFDDPMEVTAAETPDAGPWLCRIAKRGRVVRGSLTATLREEPGPVTLLDWDQSIAVAAIPSALEPIVAVVARLAYASALRRIVGVRRR